MQSILEVWSSPETGTLTALLTDTNGNSCVVASGNNWFLEKNRMMPAGITG